MPRYRLRTLLIVLAIAPLAIWLAYWSINQLGRTRAPAEGTLLFHGAGPPIVYKSSAA